MGEPDTTPRHSIGVVEQRTGLPAHTLRAWERRYGAVEPARSEGGHRLYTEAEIRRLALLAELTGAGHRIGRIAGLDTARLRELAAEEGPPSPDAAAGDEEAGAAALVEELYGAVQAYDGDRLEHAFRRAALAMSAHGLVQRVVAPLLGRIGKGWERREISPAQEHLASGVVMRTLGWLMESCEPAGSAPRAVVATPAGQRHNLGALLAAATAAASGWRVSYLGGDLPASEIARAAREVEARAVALSVVHPERSAFTEELARLRAEAPEGLVVLVGGRAAERRASEVEETGARLLRDYGELRAVLEEIAR